MKHRVGPYRRVFVFTHHSIPRDPIIILHCALTRLPSSNIQVVPYYYSLSISFRLC